MGENSKTKSLGHGLYKRQKRLKNGAWGKEYWAMRFPDAAGKRPWKMIAPCDAMTEKVAKQTVARLNVNHMVDGEDPRNDVSESRAFLPFALEMIKKKFGVGRSEKEVANWKRCVNVSAASLHTLPLSAITPIHVQAILEPMMLPKAQGGAPIAGRGVRQKLYNIFAAAKALRLRKGENPAEWRQGLKFVLPKLSDIHTKKPHAAIPYPLLPDMMKRLRYETARAARCVEFAILTCARSQEVRFMRWDQVNITGADKLVKGKFKTMVVPPNTWLVPGGLMKMKRDHIVPLSDAAVAILRTMQPITGDGKLVFPSDHMIAHKPFNHNALNRTVKAAAPDVETTPHGTSRTTFRTWGGDNPAGFHRDVLEFCIAHVEGEEAELAYWRGDMLDRRRVVMDAWGAFAMSTVPPARRVFTDTGSGAKVVSLRAPYRRHAA